MENNELKKDRFKRVASRRVENILKGIRSLSKCSNINNYEYNEEDLNKMIKAIKVELNTMELHYKKNLKQDTESFNFWHERNLPSVADRVQARWGQKSAAEDRCIED